MPECTEFIFSNKDLVIKKMKGLLVVLSGKVICIFLLYNTDCSSVTCREKCLNRT